jgi:hypothetical protein
MPDLLDVSVWLPLSVVDHVHHLRARRYWDETSGELALCRVTALGLLRLLTNRQVMGDVVLSGAAAWAALERWRATPRIRYLEEPTGLDDLLGRWGGGLDIRAGGWTDAYLAAFALAGGCRLVTFDGDFRRFSGLSLLRLAG